MTRISDYIKLAFIKTDSQSKSKKKIIEEMVKMLEDAKEVSKKKSLEVYKALLRRESMGSTGIGQGVALPHVKISIIKKTRLLFANSASGIEFNSLDGEPVNIVFLLVGPDTSGAEYIKILSTLAQNLNDPYFRRSLAAARKKKEVLDVIRKKEKS
ncbi:MAG: hypothetical protein COT16_00505 [Elusimicrobia bacterium CG08_land_8_20_14_0_20_44_26]|nr:MAG: hypothetical protein COT16_00505 [Elusimicrobia bacterium CG08_land_8_20_14_0_20_44_26]